MAAPAEVKPRNQQIRELFEVEGGAMGNRQFAELCIYQGIFDADRHEVLVNYAMSQIRRALKEDTSYGIPFAGPTAERDEESGAVVWKKLELWTYEDFEWDARQGSDALTADLARLKRKNEFCLEKYGKAPVIPELMYPAEVA
jgi:hypothetical protein